MTETFPEGTTLGQVRAKFAQLKRQGNDAAEDVIETIDQMHGGPDMELEEGVLQVFRHRLRVVLGEVEEE